MKRPVIVLSDEHIGSYAVIGDLLVRTLTAVGVQAEHHPLRAALTPETIVPREAIAIHNTVGPRFAPLPGRRNVAMVHHEWDRYPKGWVNSLNQFSEVWVTTAFVRRTLLTSGVTAPIVLVRPALDADPIPAKSSYDIRGPVQFFACGAPHFRKGHHLLMEGFLRAFPREGTATLVIHTDPKRDWGSPRGDIQIDDAPLTRSGLLGRYREFDLFVSASLGEGLGLPVAEAIFAGLPVVTNDWGGHSCLLRAGAFFRFPHEVVPQSFCSRPDFFAAGQRCAVTSVDGIARTLRRAASTSAKTRSRMAFTARQALLTRYGQRAVVQRLKTSRCIASLLAD
jgi:glycosyltransferase involved in cell wall biosynthesis